MACCEELKAVAATPPTPCECPLAGYCQRHGVEKIERWHQLCKTRPDFWNLYESGVGPGQPGLLAAQGQREAYIPNPPSLLQSAWNLATSVSAFIADGFATVSPEQYAERLTICSTCDRRSENRCLACNCYLPLKAQGRAMKCPLGKWPVTAAIRGYDIDGVLVPRKVNPVSPYVVISCRRETFLAATIEQIGDAMPIYLRTFGADGDREAAGNWKAGKINELGVTEFYEDDPVQAAIISRNCPRCRVVMVT
jgi:hypothetical protein